MTSSAFFGIFLSFLPSEISKCQANYYYYTLFENNECIILGVWNFKLDG